MDFNSEIYAGNLVMLIFKSEKCPACDRQTASISELPKNPRYRTMKFFSVDFDLEKPIVQKFKVTKSGTIILMKGTSEVYRSSEVQKQSKLEFAVANALRP
jgi:thioredoxin 1